MSGAHYAIRASTCTTKHRINACGCLRDSDPKLGTRCGNGVLGASGFSAKYEQNDLTPMQDIERLLRSEYLLATLRHWYMHVHLKMLQVECIPYCRV